MLVIHNLPEAWVSEYLDNNYILNDPIARHCIEARNPFLWREAIEATASREAKDIMIRAEKYGLKNGVCFPIHNINGFEAGVSLSGFPAPPKTDRNSLTAFSVDYGLQCGPKDPLGSFASHPSHNRQRKRGIDLVRTGQEPRRKLLIFCLSPKTPSTFTLKTPSVNCPREIRRKR